MAQYIYLGVNGRRPAEEWNTRQVASVIGQRVLGGWDHVSHLVRDREGVPTSVVATLDHAGKVWAIYVD